MSEGSFIEYVQETVTILRPMPSVYPRGMYSDAKRSAAYSVRYPKPTLSEIKEAAALIGVSVSEFIRWSAHATAMDIIKQKQEYDKQSGS